MKSNKIPLIRKKFFLTWLIAYFLPAAGSGLTKKKTGGKIQHPAEPFRLYENTG
jgi:hypothetical protein